MTPEERLANYLLSTQLGPLVPFFGFLDVATDLCECGKITGYYPHPTIKGKMVKHVSGKHPRGGEGWQVAMDYDHEVIRGWVQVNPRTNMATITGADHVVLDLDVSDNKDGVAELAQLEADAGEKLNPTVTVVSGSGLGKHLYFKIPPDLEHLQKPKGTHAIDFLRTFQAAIVPGSLHSSGGYYHFAPGLSPNEVPIAEIPAWLLALMKKTHASPRKKGIDSVGTLFADMLKEGPPKGSLRPGRLRPNSVVERRMKRVDMRSRSKPDGTFDRSESDLQYASSLAYFTAHHWKQFLELWQTLGIRDLPDTKCGRSSYERDCLTRAFLGQKQQWKNKDKRVRPIELDHPLADLTKKMRGTGKTFGQPRSQNTVDILAAHHDEPHLKDAALVKKLNKAKTTDHVFSRDECKKVRGRYPHLWA